MAGQPVRFGEVELEVRFAPGHAPGHVVFYHEPTATVIGGDVLFQRSIGRTDLPGGNHAELLHSIETEPDDPARCHGGVSRARPGHHHRGGAAQQPVFNEE
ncbi:MBL fold metallo-hydrolase [Hymenobacter humi]|uniref:MBL fold metallo-hydrolase n=1 Tax=Hymenobacter humi TaxID=1411620 RepID=A0ABW2TXQ1_9BACT